MLSSTSKPLVALPFLAGLALAVLGATSASAQVHLRWNECFGGPTATTDRTFACDRNTGSERLVLSFAPFFAVQGVSGFEATIGLGTTGAPMPSWWLLGQSGMISGGCSRPGVIANPVPDPSWTSCSAPLNGLTYAFYQMQPMTPQFALLKLTVAPVDTARIAPSDGEVFVVTLTVPHARSTLPDSCAGCSAPVCLQVMTFAIDTIDPEPYRDWIDLTAAPENGLVVWQGALGGLATCPGIVPTRNRTWGAIKSMYR